VPVPG